MGAMINPPIVADIHSSEEQMACGLGDGSVMVFHEENVKKKKKLKQVDRLRGHFASVSCVRYATPGQLWSAANDGSLVCWNVQRWSSSKPSEGASIESKGRPGR